MKPYLIQRGKINKGYCKDNRLSMCVNLDYMESAQFEFGALPKSLRRIEPNLTQYILKERVFVRNLIISIAYPPGFDIDTYIGHLISIVDYDREKVPLKEWTGMENMSQQHEMLKRFNFWWDIENDIMWSLDNIFMRCLPLILKNSIEFMNCE